MWGQLDICSQTYPVQMYPHGCFQWPRTVLNQVSLTFAVRHTQLRCTPWWRHLMAKTRTELGPVDLSSEILHSRGTSWARPELSYIWLAGRGSSGQLDLQVRCTPTEASIGQEWYYIRSALHLVSLLVRLTCKSDVPPSRGSSDQLDMWSVSGSGYPAIQMYPPNSSI